jgi:hypothetical protein
MEGRREGGEGDGQNAKLHTEDGKTGDGGMEHLFELGLAIGNLGLTRASVGTLPHEEMVFRLEIEGLLQR